MLRNAYDFSPQNSKFPRLITSTRILTTGLTVVHGESTHPNYAIYGLIKPKPAVNSKFSIFEGLNRLGITGLHSKVDYFARQLTPIAFLTRPSVPFVSS